MSLAFWRSVCDLQLICDNVRISQSCDNILFCWVRGGTWTNFQRISSKKVTYDSRKLCCFFFFKDKRMFQQASSSITQLSNTMSVFSCTKWLKCVEGWDKNATCLLKNLALSGYFDNLQCLHSLWFSLRSYLQAYVK